MNKIKKCISIIVLIFIFLPTISFAWDYRDDFEGDLSKWFCTPQDFIYESDGTAIARGVGIVKDPENSDNNVLLIDGTPGRAYASWNFGNLSGVVEISFKVRLEEAGDNVIYFAMIGSEDGDVIAPNIHNGYFAYKGDDGNYDFKSGATENVWHNVKYIIDTGSLKYTVNINGTNRFVDYPLDKKAINGICKFTSWVDGSKTYIDDIWVNNTAIENVTHNIWMYSTKYQVDDANKTIGNFRYNTPKSVLLESVKTLDGVGVSISGGNDGKLTGGEALTLTKGSEQQVYAINVRNPSMTELNNKVAEDSQNKYPTAFKAIFKSIMNTRGVYSYE